MSIVFARREVSTPEGSVYALVLEPSSDVEIGAERLRDLRRDAVARATDDEIVEAVSAGGDGVELTVFRAGGGRGRWTFDPDLSLPELEELAQLLLISQMPAYVALFEAGVFLHIRVGVGSREQSALRAAQASLARRVEVAMQGSRSTPFPGATVPPQLHLWILREMLFLFSRPLEELLRETLPPKLVHLRRRAERTRQELGMLDKTQPIHVG